jgi:hypothetical protein
MNILNNILKLVLILTIYACTFTRVLKRKEIHNFKVNAKSQISASLEKVKKDFEKRTGLIKEVNEFLVEKKDRRLLIKIRDLTKIKNNFLHLTNISNRVLRSIPNPKGKKVRENTTEYTLIMESRNNLEIEFNKLQKSGENYSRVAKEIDSLLSEKKIYYINPIKLTQNIKEHKIKTNKQFNKIEKNLNAYKLRILHTKNESKVTLFSKLRPVFKLIKKERKNLMSYLEKLNTKIIDSKKNWVAPGMLGHDYKEKITLIIKSLQVEVNKFNQIVAKINKK